MERRKKSKAPSDSKTRFWTKRAQECLVLSGEERLVISRANGIELVDVDGKAYMDFTGGSHVCNLGYSNTEIIDATKKQMDILDFIPHHMSIFSLRIRLAERLRRKAPGNLKEGRVSYCNTGSEATEFSIKLARYSTRRQVLFTCIGGYYGATMGALSLTVDDSNLRRWFSPFLPAVVPIPYANCYRCSFGQEYGSCGFSCVNFVKQLLDTVVRPEEVAAIFLEPVQNHGGVIVPPVEYLRRLKDICSEYGILLVDNEVVTAFGKTGKMFGIEHFGIEPDIMYFGKPIGVGLPLGAILASRDLTENWHGAESTLAANPLACARALTMIRMIDREKLLHNARRVGEHILRRLCEIAEKHLIVGDVRGKGLLIGIELVRDQKTKQPASSEAKYVSDYCFRKGLLIAKSGPYKNILKLSPPLVLDEEQADAGIDVIERSLKEVGH